jgi:hypothetical protein
MLKTTYIKSFVVEPVCDVGACSKNDGVAFGLLVVVVQKLRQVVHLVEKRYPAVVVGVMLSNFSRDVVVAHLVRTRVGLG